MIDVKRGQIWLVNLDPTVGHEIKKTRPCVILQNDLGNKYSLLTIIAPITSKDVDTIYPMQVLLTKQERGIDVTSKALLNQIRTVDTIRLIRKLGEVGLTKMREVDEALKISLWLVDV